MYEIEVRINSFQKRGDMDLPIYFDYASTTPVAPEVLSEMLPYLTHAFGNASSRTHAYGWQAKAAVELASQQLARLCNVLPADLTFTSGATEAINLALKGLAGSYGIRKSHFITAATEHSAALDTLQYLETKGAEITVLPVDKNGEIDLGQLSSTIRPTTVACCVMLANNETGVMHDVAAIGRICASQRVLLCCDATQAVGKIEFNPRTLGIDMLALSGHKFYGPQGVGALWINPNATGAKVTAQLHGGAQQSGLRSGTLNVAGVVGLGAASVLAKASMQAEYRRLELLRDAFEAQILSALGAVYVVGSGSSRLAHISNLCIRFVAAETLISKLQRAFALSSGSACASGSMDPSHVLLAMGLSVDDAKCCIRVSLGCFTTSGHVGQLATRIVEVAEQLRAESPVWELYTDGVL